MRKKNDKRVCNIERENERERERRGIHDAGGEPKSVSYAFWRQRLKKFIQLAPSRRRRGFVRSGCDCEIVS